MSLRLRTYYTVTVAVVAGGERGGLGGIAGRAERVRAHVRDCRRLLGGVGRRCGRWSWGIPRRCAGITAATAHRLANWQIAAGEGACLLDRVPDPRVVADPGLVDRQDVLGAVGRPRRDQSAIIGTQRLRGARHRVDGTCRFDRRASADKVRGTWCRSVPPVSGMGVSGMGVVASAQVSTRRWWLVAVAVGLLLGPLDLWGQVVTPYPWAHLFNSPSVWAAAAFGYGRWARGRIAAPLGATIALVVAVEAYYLADVVVRGASASNLTSPTAVVWLAAAVLAGIVFGVAGESAPLRAGWRTVLGRGALPAVFGAEAVRNALRVASEPADGRPADLGQFAAVLAVLSAVCLLIVTRRVERRVGVAVTAVAVGAAAAIGVTAHVVI